MYYIYQLATDMFFYGCLYFSQVMLLVICNVLGVDTPLTNKIVVLSFTSMLIVFSIISIAIKQFKNKKYNTTFVFHPQSSFRQRLSFLFLVFSTALHCIFAITILFVSEFATIALIVSNVISVLFLIIALTTSLFHEALPDKDDTILFDETALYYYMRVKKDSKFNKSMNSYIIPYDAILRSYINKNKLYIEYDRNHPDLKITRQFSTNTKRIVIDFTYYPQIKNFALKKENTINLKLRKYADITNATYI
jgi:hypothetical protein